MPAALTADARSRWALVLGASSGFGEACSLELARGRLEHLRRPPGPQGARSRTRTESSARSGPRGRRAEFFNVNAADDEKRAEVIAAIQKTCGGDPPRVARLGPAALAGVRDAEALLRRAARERDLQGPDRDDARRHGELARLLDAGPLLREAALAGRAHLRDDLGRGPHRVAGLRRGLGGQVRPRVLRAAARRGARAAPASPSTPCGRASPTRRRCARFRATRR